MTRFLLLLVLVLLAVYYLRRRRAGQAEAPAGPLTLRVGEVEATLRGLENAGVEESFVLLNFRAPDGDDSGDRVNLHYSIADGRPGLDWFLLTTVNARDRDRFLRFAGDRGHQVRPREMDAVPYLRVEDGDPAALTLAVMREMYGLSPDARIEMLVEGVEPREILRGGAGA